MLSFKHHHTHLTGQDPQKTIDFYTGLGAKITNDSTVGNRRLVDIDLGGINIRISGSTGADEKWQGSRYGLHHLGLSVNDMDEFAAKWKAGGGEFVLEPYQSPSGLKVAFVKSPDNVLFEIMEAKGG